MQLSTVEQALLLAAYFRGNTLEDGIHSSSCDQVVTLSLFYTGAVTFEDCAARFAVKSYVGGLYDEQGELHQAIVERYHTLIDLTRRRPELIECFGNLQTPADPTYTACRLTAKGRELAASLVGSFPPKPEFPNWPDRTAAGDTPRDYPDVP
jgi:hypothetical protein